MSKNKKKIVCVVSHCPDALINKRLEMLKNDYDVTVIYNERGNENFFKFSGVSYKKLSLKFGNGDLLKRVFCLAKLKNEIKKILKEENPDIVYAFRLDMLVLVLANGYKNKKIVYEVADLHEAVINTSKNLMKKITKVILTFTEKCACKNVDLLSITSEKYYDVYFSKFIDKSKVVYMPNIPNLEYFKDYKKGNNDEFVVGFIGFVRYKKQMKLLIEAAQKANVKVFFAGSSQDDEIKKLAEESRYIEYYGRYDYNTEIAKLYAKCDCIYSVYDISYNNVKYALPNKLYESIYCELPILVAKDTFLSQLVEKWGVGISIDSNLLDDLVEKIVELKNNKKLYSTIINNCKKNKSEINMKRYNDIFIEMLKRIN